MPEAIKKQFLGAKGSRSAEWHAWKDFDAVDALSEEESAEVYAKKKDNIIPTRWVETDKAESKFEDDAFPKEMIAKSRLVVTGFRDKLLGVYRRGAPTASGLREAMLLSMAASLDMTLELGDVKNVHFNGDGLQGEVCLTQQKGGLPGLVSSQLNNSVVASQEGP